MYKAFKYRIYPTKEQITLLNKHIGCARFIYNLALETKISAYKGNKIKITCFELINQLTDLKKEYTWLKEIDSQSLQASIRNMDTAFLNLFKGSGFPKFKKKSNGGSFTAPKKVYLRENKLSIPKFREGIRVAIDRPLKGTVKQATVSRTPTGKYFVSILCDTGEAVQLKPEIKGATSLGIDLGLKHFLVTSEGEVVDNPKYLKESLNKLKYVQSKYSKYKGKRTRHRLAIIHEKISNKRKDFLHQLSTRLVRENQTICLEDLAVKNMGKNHNLAQAISDVSWSTFTEMITYKGDWYGSNILKIGRFAPSSKTCSCCGSINKELTLQDREWTCSGCGTLLDRDENAAINIKSFALEKILSGTDRKNQDELPRLRGVLTPEAQILTIDG